MDMELALPQSVFRTYLDVNTRVFKTHHYVEAPLKTFSPPGEWDLSQGAFRRMISLDTTRFYDTETAARPLSYVIIPAEITDDERRLMGLSMFEYAADPSYISFPVQSTIPAQVRALNVHDQDACVVSMPSPNCSRHVPLTTLFHEVVIELRYGHHLQHQDHRKQTSWFDCLPRAVQLYLAPIQNQWLTVWPPSLRSYTSGVGTCELCGVYDHNLRRHHLRHHATMRAIFFCPVEGCPSVLTDQQGLWDHLRQDTHRGGATPMGHISAFAAQNCFWPLTREMAAAILRSPQKLHAYVMLYSYAGVALQRTF